jgi:subtilase family serine protease
MLRHATIGLVVLVMVTFGFVSAVSGGVAAGIVAVENAVVHTEYAAEFYGPAGPAQLPTNGVCPIGGGAYLHCFSPQDIQSAYNYAPAYTSVGGYANAGAGQTIVIFDAYGDPTVKADLATFDAQFGLPSATLNIICPDGCPIQTGALPQTSLSEGWAGEISLDTQYSHAMAPAATIDLVIAPSQSNWAFVGTETYALDHHLGNIWSQSFGTPECDFGTSAQHSWLTPNNEIYSKAAAEGITIFASAGDGWAQEGCATPSASYPADNPNNIGVAGTYLNLSFASGASVGTYNYERTWNDFENPLLVSEGLVFGGTGGSPSHYFAPTPWQVGRTVTPYQCSGTPLVCITKAPHYIAGKNSADVDYNAGVDGGVLTYFGFFPNAAERGFYIVGGTSAGSPQWAAIASILDQLNGGPLGNIAPSLYGLIGSSSFHVIKHGSDTIEYPGFLGEGYLATPTWSAAAGVGTPNVGVLATYF